MTDAPKVPELTKNEVKSELENKEVKDEAMEVEEGFTPLEIDPLDQDLTTDEIEDDIINNPEILMESESNPKSEQKSETKPDIQANSVSQNSQQLLSTFSSISTFKKSLNSRYKNFDFDEDDYLILWNLPCVKQNYLKAIQIQVDKIELEIKNRKRKSDELNQQIKKSKENKTNVDTYELVPKIVRSRNVVAHDSTVLHLRFCSLCNTDSGVSEFDTYEQTLEHLYTVKHINKLEACFYKGSQPQLNMKSLKCNVCNTKTVAPTDINSSIFEHIASYSHAVKGISPPGNVSRQLKLSCRAALCAFYVDKNMPTHLAQQASGHVLGQASSGAFMMTGDRQLNKTEMKHHPLRLGTCNEIENEDTLYKSASFQTFCMTHGMTSDQVKTMWNWQPLFLPLTHIRGKCGLCKEQVEHSMDEDKSDSNKAKMSHLNDVLHANFCRKEVNEIDDRLRFTVPIDVKCFILSYCSVCERGLGAWNSVLSHILDRHHKRQVLTYMKSKNQIGNGAMDAMGARTFIPGTDILEPKVEVIE